MQQNSAILIYDFNKIKGTVVSCLKKNYTAIQNSVVSRLKNRT